MIYEPAEDSLLLEKEVRKLAKRKTFLDLGSGSGIQTKAAMESGATSVLAADIDLETVNHLKSKGIPSVRSDLFSNIKGKFNLIAFNPPYLPEDMREPKSSRKATTGGKKGDEIILKFLKSAKSHLNKNGVILLVISSLTHKSRILTLLKKQALNKEVLSKKKLFMETLEVWKIFS
jgi:release factor glutamine methyltransferase